MFPQKQTDFRVHSFLMKMAKGLEVRKYRFWMIMNELQRDRFLKRNLTKFDLNDLAVFFKKYVFMLSHRSKTISDSSFHFQL
jgi:hypothetical protein